MCQKPIVHKSQTPAGERVWTILDQDFSPATFATPPVIKGRPGEPPLLSGGVLRDSKGEPPVIAPFVCLSEIEASVRRQLDVDARAIARDHLARKSSRASR